MNNIFKRSPASQKHEHWRKKSSKHFSEEELYSEQAVWLCENRKTSFKTRIQGTLALILKKYPSDYKLRVLSVKGAPA